MYRQISRRQMLGFVGVAALTPSLLLEEPVHAKKRGTPSSKERGAPVESISQPQFMETGRVISTEPGTGKLLHLELVICATLPDGRTIKKQIDFLNLSTDIISQTKKYFDVRMIGNGIVLTMDEREVRVFSLGIEDEDIKPQMIQRYDHTSHASENFIGKKELVALVKIYREEYNLPIILNLDHAKDFESCKDAVEVGFNYIHFDGSLLPYKENLEVTKKVVELAHAQNIPVEGEMDHIQGSSADHTKEKPDEVLDKTLYTDPKKAKIFVDETGIDTFAAFF